jgi:hypothetical protein
VPVARLSVTGLDEAGLDVTGTAGLAVARTWLAVTGNRLAVPRLVVGRLRVRWLDGGAGLRRLSFAVAKLRFVRARA